MNKKQRIYTFIDSQNLNLGIQRQGWRLDFQKFHDYLKRKYKVSRAFLFIGYISKNKDLYKALKKFGYILIFKEVVVRKVGRNKYETKGNVDAELVLQTMIEFNKFDKALIVSGDGDFKCLIRYLSQKDKLLKVFIPNQKKFSSLLIPFRKHLVFANNLRAILASKKK